MIMVGVRGFEPPNLCVLNAVRKSTGKVFNESNIIPDILLNELKGIRPPGYEIFVYLNESESMVLFAI